MLCVYRVSREYPQPDNRWPYSMTKSLSLASLSARQCSSVSVSFLTPHTHSLSRGVLSVSQSVCIRLRRAQDMLVVSQQLLVQVSVFVSFKYVHMWNCWANCKNRLWQWIASSRESHQWHLSPLCLTTLHLISFCDVRQRILYIILIIIITTSRLVWKNETKCACD